MTAGRRRLLGGFRPEPRFGAAALGEVRFEIWDTGIGIEEADRQRIFEEFVQLDNPERDRRKGLGLGLSIEGILGSAPSPKG